MPSKRTPPAASATRNPAMRLLRVGGMAAIAVVAAFCALLLAVRFVVFPQLEEHHGDIAEMLARELRAPVEIDRIVTGWDGWNPRIAIEGLRVRDRAGALSEAVIELPLVTGVVSWTSLFTADLRLRELTIERPWLAVRRDRDGHVHVAGLRIDPSELSTDTAVTDWLLRQRLIVVRDALVAWSDDLRSAPQLLLDDVQFRLENRFGQHRFGLKGTPPPEIAAPIDLRGDLTAASFEDWRKASGRVYLRLDYADAAAWSEWLPLPFKVERGQGALRAWFDFNNGAPREIVVDVELADVRTRLADDLAPLDLTHVAGRVTWQQEGTRRTLVTRALTLAGRDGLAIAPTDVELRYERAPDGETASGRLAFKRIELAPLAQLAPQLPLPARVREELARHAPRGTLVGGTYAWEGPVGSPARYRTQGTFADLGARSYESLPGFAGVAGRFEATHEGGTLELDSRNTLLLLPRVFAEPVVLDTASGRVRWERRGDVVSVRLDDIQYANAHAAGTAQGTWKSRGKGPGEIDFSARLTRADARQVYRYFPLIVGEPLRAWLRDSLLAGTSDDARLTLKGDLARFPFADGKSGTFLLTVKANDTTLDYAGSWPRLVGVEAALRFEGARMSIEASRGRILGAALGRTTATIANLATEHPQLEIEGEASGSTDEFLRFVAASPVAAWIDHAADGASATGNGRLALRLGIGLGRDEIASIAGDYQFADNELRIKGAPALAHVNGKLTFTERTLSGSDLKLETLGGPARVSIASREGTVSISGTGQASLAAVQREFAMPLAERFTGTTDWQLALEMRRELASWTLESSLRGAAVDLPQPLGKQAAGAMPLKVTRRPVPSDANRDVVMIDYGKETRLVLQRQGEGASSRIERGLLLLGKAANAVAQPERAGLTIRGDLPHVNVDEWLALQGAAAADQARHGAGFVVEAVDLEAGALVALGRRFESMTLSARHAADRWRLRFSSRQADGTAEWEPAGSKLANGRFTAALVQLDFNAMRDAATGEPVRNERREGSANPWPEIDIRAERFIARAGNLGRMELSARPEGADWRVSRFALVNDGGRIDAKGGWRMLGAMQQTDFDVEVDLTDTPAFLSRMGLPAALKGAPARLEGTLGWNGAPTDFEYEKLTGRFTLKAGAGQFTKLDPGVGKLLGVLSLQALPRRIALDFRDVFSEGFAFDTVTGTVRVANGVMHTDDLTLAGPAAKVTLAGDADLASETQALTVRVQPSLSSVVSTGAGAAAVMLLAANPLVGAAVGAGTLLAQKIMKDPIEQMFSYEYSVKGAWSDPQVERVGPRPLPPVGEAASESAVSR